MNKRNIILIIIILLVTCISLGVCLQKMKKNKNEIEIKPQEEISDEQMRKTIVTLYYQDKETKLLVPEGKMLDSKNLLSDPYIELFNLLKEEPKNEKLQSIIPKETRVLKTELKGDILYLDLSKEFVDNNIEGNEQENNLIYSIVNTMTELNEVNGVKILINGKENQEFKDKKINFNNPFLKIKNN